MGRTRVLSTALFAVAFGVAAAAPPAHDRPGPPRPPAATPSRGSDAVPLDLESLLRTLGEKAHVYESLALKFICIETVRSSNDPGDEKRFDYMYVDTLEQRYLPYRQKHTGRPGRGTEETSLKVSFPDSYSWTLMFVTDRQHIFHFEYAGEEWFSLRRTHILKFTAPLPFTSGQTIYEWSGRVWIDAENYNFLKVEATPGNQDERLKLELKAYRQAPRILIFPIGHAPRGARYNITFLNEFQKLSLPDLAEYRVFVLDLDGSEELEDIITLDYAGYQFYDVDVRDKFLK